MLRRRLCIMAVFAIPEFALLIVLLQLSWAQERHPRRPQGTLRVAHFGLLASSGPLDNYAEYLVGLDKDNNWVPELAEDWRWIDDKTLELKLRQGVTFHNGERFDAEAVKVNWEHYRELEQPTPSRVLNLTDEIVLKIFDEYKLRFIFPAPDALAFVKFFHFSMFAPSFFVEHTFGDYEWGYLNEAGPWGTGPFKLIEGTVSNVKSSDRIVLEAYERYWDPRYPKVQRLLFDNTLKGDREKALKLCRETEGAVDIVTFLRPLDTLKMAESAFAKVVKSKDVTLLEGWFNMRKKASKWKDKRLRKALNYAINREELWKYAARGNAYNLGGFIPAGAFGHNPELKLFTYDTKKARALLAEAGYPSGFEMKIIAPEAFGLEAQIISKMLERIGIEVSFESMSYSELLGGIHIPSLEKPPEEQNWDLSLVFVNNMFGSTIGSLLTWPFLEESDLRWIEYDEVYERLWRSLIGTMDLGSQEEKTRQVVKYVYDRAYCLFIYSPFSLYAVNKEVEFVPQKCNLLRLKETSLTENHWSIRGKNN
jgi:peptide/nickel transport system substrate-binding protein